MNDFNEDKNYDEFSNFVGDFEREAAEELPDENSIVSLVRQQSSVDMDVLRRGAVEYSHLLSAEIAESFNAVILDAPNHIYKYHIGLLKPLSSDDKRRLSRILEVYSTTAIKYQILDGMVFQILFGEAYGKHNLIKTQNRKERQQTRETRTWGDSDGNDSGIPKKDKVPPKSNIFDDVKAFEESAGGRYDISDISSYYELKKKFDSGEITENDIDTLPFVYFMLQDFILSGASDLHVHSNRAGGRIRYRYQGEVYTRFEGIPPVKFQRIVYALCTMSGKDSNAMSREIVESVIKLKILIEGEIKPVEFRFESMPTLHNPSVNLRGQAKPLRDINKIGLTVEQKQDVLQMISKDRGIVVVTGPTGSGKTNTLNCVFAILEEPDDRVIIEIGSPIEIESPMRVQLNVTETPTEKQSDIIYQKYFKACMRFDPDVIGFTEIRNSDEARIAFRAAVTGHLVFTTLHAADVEETLGRLFEMKIDRSIIAKGILGIVAQTLIRKLCDNCKTEDRDASLMAGKPIYKENEEGCPSCDYGFSGRTVVAEVLRFNEDIQHWINDGYKAAEIAQLSITNGYLTPMKRVALGKLNDGITSESEVINLVELRTEINSDAEEMPEYEDFTNLAIQDADYVDIK